MKDTRLEIIAKSFEKGTKSNDASLNISWRADDGWSYHGGALDTAELVRKALEAYEAGATIEELEQLIIHPIIK